MVRATSDGQRKVVLTVRDDESSQHDHSEWQTQNKSRIYSVFWNLISVVLLALRWHRMLNLQMSFQDMNIVISLNIKMMLELIDAFRGRETSQTRLSRIREISSSYKLRAVKSIFFPLCEWKANINLRQWNEDIFYLIHLGINLSYFLLGW